MTDRRLVFTKHGIRPITPVEDLVAFAVVGAIWVVASLVVLACAPAYERSRRRSGRNARWL